MHLDSLIMEGKVHHGKVPYFGNYLGTTEGLIIAAGVEMGKNTSKNNKYK